MEFVRTIFRSLFEDTTITTNFLKAHICNTLALKSINRLLFSTINDRGISTSDQIILYLKKWALVNGKPSKYKCYETGHADLVFQKK